MTMLDILFDKIVVDNYEEVIEGVDPNRDEQLKSGDLAIIVEATHGMGEYQMGQLVRIKGVPSSYGREYECTKNGTKEGYESYGSWVGYRRCFVKMPRDLALRILEENKRKKDTRVKRMFEEMKRNGNTDYTYRIFFRYQGLSGLDSINVRATVKLYKVNRIRTVETLKKHLIQVAYEQLKQGGLHDVHESRFVNVSDFQFYNLTIRATEIKVEEDKVIV